MKSYRHQYLKYKRKYLSMKGGNNKLFAEYLANFMKEHDIANTQYAIIAGYCVARITGRIVTDLDVIISKDAYNKLSDAIDSSESAAISKTPKLSLETQYGEIEFFERENTGFPSNTFSLKNLHKNKMLDYDEFDNPFLNTQATILHYADVKKVGDKLILGEGHEITPERLKKNISHLTLINNIINDKELDRTIKSLQNLLN